MVAFKASAVQRFLRAPDPECRATLIYGPDAGLVSERAAALAKVFLGREGADAETVRLDDRDFAEDPARLDIELRTQSMFAKSKVVRVSAGNRIDAPSLKALLEAPSDNVLIVEAGALRPDSALRKLFEKIPHGAALPCYGDELGLGSVIDEELAAAGLTIDRETKSYLTSRLGADQALSRAEVAKLALYAQGDGQGDRQGDGRVSHDDIEAIVGDAAEIALDNFVYAVSAGDVGPALHELHRLGAAGTEHAAALSALARHYCRLYVVAAHKGGVEAAAKALRPPLHFKRKDAFLAHSRKWGATRLAQALPLIQETVRRTRRSPEIGSAFAERLLLALASKV